MVARNGRGSLSDRHPLAIVQLGLSELLPASDVVLVVGSRGLDFTTNPLRVAPGATLSWNELTKHATGENLNAKAFAAEFAAE